MTLEDKDGNIYTRQLYVDIGTNWSWAIAKNQKTVASGEGYDTLADARAQLNDAWSILQDEIRLSVEAQVM